MRLAPRFALILLFLALAASALAAPARRTAPGPRLEAQDFARRLDLNRVRLVVANDGSFGYDVPTGSAGLWYPAGTPGTLLFAGGLWLSARLQGDPSVRVAVSEYSSEFTPGDWVFGGDYAGLPEHRVYKMARFTGDPLDTAHVDRAPADLLADPTLDPLLHDSWSDYMSGAAAHGAPWRLYRLPDTSTLSPTDSVDVPGPDLPGDLAVWAVFHDGVASHHTAGPGGTAPLGMEVQQTAFVFDRPGPLANTVFFRYRIVNQGGATYDDLVASLWTDPDLGDFTDDLTGFDLTRGIGYAYNGDSYDAAYGTRTPALGLVQLERNASGWGTVSGPWASFVKYTNGTDPNSALETYNSMHGLDPGGTPIIDPVTSNPTTWMHTGDPVAQTGWLDTTPSDRRMLCSTAPTPFGGFDTLTVWAAMIVGEGTNTSNSILALRCESEYVTDLWASGFAEPFPSPGSCGLPLPPLVNCPRTRAYWLDQCQGVNPQYSYGDLALIAHAADSLSEVFSWGTGGNAYTDFCAAADPPSPGAADSARADYAAFLMNFMAGALEIPPTGGAPIGLLSLTPLAGAPLAPTAIGLLSAPLPDMVQVDFADYVDDVPLHPAALVAASDAPVPAGSPVGVTVASHVYMSSIDVFMPDSFPPSVELRFDQAGGQMASRFLRPERQSDGLQPAGPSLLIYAGRSRVPFACIDTTTGDTLEVAFVERVLTDDGGTILDPWAQPATFDSTWAPSSEASGGREWLWILRRPYTPDGYPEFEVDNLPLYGTWPALFFMAAKLVDGGAVMDDGDRVRINTGLAPQKSAETLLLRLGSALPSDTSATRQLRQLSDYLAAINRGDGIGALCNDPTPALASLLDATAEPGVVRLTWYLGGSPANSARLERSTDGTSWSDLGAAAIGGDGYVRATDTAVSPGTRYAYRLAMFAADGASRSATVWVDVPRASTLELAGLRPNPATGGRLVVTFSLPVRAPATIEVLDLAGRLVQRREVGALGPGWHTVDLGSSTRVAPGLYLLRLRQGELSLSRKAVVVR